MHAGFTTLRLCMAAIGTPNTQIALRQVSSYYSRIILLKLPGCQDGLIRVFDYSMRDTPIFLLKGHSARVFSVSWSPLLPNTLCSGSDDTTVIVWNVRDVLMCTRL